MKQIQAEINRLVNILVKEQNHDGSWSCPFETGIATDCYMIILLRTLEINDEDLIYALVRRILMKQEKNGAWKLFHDEEKGNLSATVEAYYAVLYSGYRTKHDQSMFLAKQFILKNGGLKEINMFTKVMLALTGRYKWPSHFPMPVELILLPTSFPVNFFDFSVYARSNLTPIFIAADYRFSIKTERSPDISDLFLNRNDHGWERELRGLQSLQSLIRQGIDKLAGYSHELHEIALEHAEKYMLQRIEPDGTFYSYFSSTFLMVFALMARGYPKQHPVIRKAVQGLTSYQTTIDNQMHIQYTTANVWNTALISYGLQEAGVPTSSETIQKAHQYLLSRQHFLYGDWAVHNQNVIPGGWGFSDINTINPDIDDTTASLRSLRTLIVNEPTYSQAWDRAVQWVVSMQNNDGGWAAFEKNVNKSFLSWLPVEGGGKMLLDPSTADLTGRTLEFLGNVTHVDRHHPFVNKGIQWLLRNQRKDGSWYGRWGICYIYGTWAALTGLLAVNVRKKHPSVQKAVQWLYSIQNKNGGWGESCNSDIMKKYVPLYESTRTHTAWALDALVSAENEETPELKRGLKFLLETSGENDWTTTYPKGQGLPGGFYIHYHSYEYLFPLLALSHYKKTFHY
ncbi:sporulene cyclase [Alteribacillus persepolensis]|uniref:Sporulene cyclase n=1 Tax=Alteribacillus persepolensis TaxID=568899 RepID=A0A1G8AL20_9BACI|nr:squalene--hopene cyclase [Alteribacillus persepolensis]SDH21651.1 sporulene cyclase [Alteribacillus persepolensis]